jgi:hypothetical protein
MKKLIVFAIAILGFTAVSFGQVNTSAATSATVITPISILKTTDLSFGTLAVSPTVAGTLVLSTAGVRDVTGGGGGVTLPAVTGTVSAAEFTVSGLAGSIYTIGLPNSITLTGDVSGTMTVNGFNSNPTVAAGGVIGGGGSQTVKVGATLNVSAGQAAGLYSNAAGLVVTVNYN